MNIIIFLGPAGSGKGTQAERLSKKLGYDHISMGDLLRQEIASVSPVGLDAKKVMDKGGLVSDTIIMKIVRNQFSMLMTVSKGIILDGFPRTLSQASELNTILLELSLKIHRVFFFDLSLEASIQRISGRQIDPRSNKVYHTVYNPAPEKIQPFLVTREDDQEEKVLHRYQVYCDQTQPLIDFYAPQLMHINCLASIDSITTTMIDAITESSSSDG